MNTYNELKKCVCCDSNDLIEVLDLKKQPLANSYHTLDAVLEEYPLKLNQCNFCSHLQLSLAVNPRLLFTNYLYVSGTTSTLKEHFKVCATDLLNQHPKAKTVLDIACNDGSLLDEFKKLNLKTYGVDPAENLTPLTINKGHEVITDYFKKNLFNTTFDIITAQNVLAHTEDPLQFLIACESYMNEESVLQIQTSQANMIFNGEFDTIYHEHISYFSPASVGFLLKRAGLMLIETKKVPIHGTSYVFTVKKDPLKAYAARVKNTIDSLGSILQKYKDTGHILVGYGAAAKGNTLLNAIGIKLDYLVDDNTLKQGLYTPGTNILISAPSILKNFEATDKLLLIPLSWNFYEEIKQKITTYRINANDLYIKYFPEIKIENA